MAPGPPHTCLQVVLCMAPRVYDIDTYENDTPGVVPCTTCMVVHGRPRRASLPFEGGSSIKRGGLWKKEAYLISGFSYHYRHHQGQVM